MGATGGYPLKAGWPEELDMRFKTIEIDGKKYIETNNGEAVMITEDGKEASYGEGVITRLSAEAMGHRKRAEAAEQAAKEATDALKGFHGIDDPAAAKQALETIKNMDSKKLIDAGEVEKVKAEISKAFQSQLDEATQKAQGLESQLYSERIGGSFSRSKLIADKFAIPADLVQARFGQSFKIEDGKTVAYDAHGNKIFSASRPGELADFEEALQTLVDQYPYRDQILRGSGASGGGAQQSSSTGGAKSISRAQFEAMGPGERVTALQSGATLTE